MFPEKHLDEAARLRDRARVVIHVIAGHVCSSFALHRIEGVMGAGQDTAMKVIGNAAVQVCGRWLNNRAKNSHQPFRRRERAMAKFRDIKTLQKFAAIHASIHNHFNHDRHLNRRDIFKQNRAAALAEWCQLAA